MGGTIERDRWITLAVGPKLNYRSHKRHLHDGRRTLCGFSLEERAMPARPGQPACRFCEMEARR